VFFYIALPNNFAKEWIENKYQKNLLGIIRNFDNSARKLEFLVTSQEPKILNNRKSGAETGVVDAQISLELNRVDPESNLNPRYTLQSFIVGSSNELAHAAASGIVEDVGKKYNPFFIYGGVGLGKTHLIQAIGNAIKEKYNNKIKPRYVSSEKFTSDVVWAIRNKRMEDIKRRYRDVDVLIIDDIQFIGGKEKTEEEFFHTFNALYENNKQIIISSDRPPQSIPTLQERLRSRFEGGLTTDINYPEYEMRVAIIKNKLQDMNRALDAQVIDLVAHAVKRNIRELEGVLNKIIFYQDKKGVRIDKKSAEDIIEKSTRSFSRRVSDEQIIKSVAEYYGIQIDDLTGRSRKKEMVEPRQVVMYLLRDILGVSYPYIGEKLGRDHTTVIHSFEKVNQEINKNSPLNQKILFIKEVLFNKS
jgi:chromosomal replication initiator protein